mmetsp:Transcript_424/g.673  ORF Transcript_424/g.673 Transcript_424/m.673 type:complete len:163 (+) Transcript_424:1370-1858(+)
MDDQYLQAKKDEYALSKLSLEKLENFKKDEKESDQKYLTRVSKEVIALKRLCSPTSTIQVPPPHMLAFHLIKGLEYLVEYFSTVLIDLSNDTPSSKSWYIPSNLGHTLQKAHSHYKSCKLIYKLPAPTGKDDKTTTKPNPSPSPTLDPFKNKHLQQLKKELI